MIQAVILHSKGCRPLSQASPHILALSPLDFSLSSGHPRAVTHMLPLSADEVCPDCVQKTVTSLQQNPATDLMLKTVVIASGVIPQTTGCRNCLAANISTPQRTSPRRPRRTSRLPVSLTGAHDHGHVQSIRGTSSSMRNDLEGLQDQSKYQSSPNVRQLQTIKDFAKRLSARCSTHNGR